MPKLNLKDDGYETEEGAEDRAESSPGLPTLHESNGNGGKVSPIIIVLVALIILAAGIFALNYFKVINLWGKRTPETTEIVPPAEEPVPAPSTDSGAPAVTQQPEPLPLPGAKEGSAPTPPAKPAPSKSRVRIVPTGDGAYTVQFAAWHSSAKAERQVQLLSGAGYDTYVDEARVKGSQWYRVRVGRFATRAEARPTADRLQDMTEDVVWIARIRSL
jgi:cell division septation protein DedD